MKKIVFLTAFVFVSADIEGMNRNLNASGVAEPNNPTANYRIRKNTYEPLGPSPTAASTSDPKASGRVNFRPNKRGTAKTTFQQNPNMTVFPMQISQTCFSPNWMAPFPSEDPKDIATLLLSVGNMMHKQNFMYRTELEKIRTRTMKQAQLEQKKYQEALQMKDRQLNNKSQQFIKNLQYYQELQSKLLHKESQLQQQLKQKDSKIQQTLQELQNVKFQHQQILEQALKQRESQYQQQLQQKEQELRDKDSEHRQKELLYQQQLQQREQELKQKDLLLRQSQQQVESRYRKEVQQEAQHRQDLQQELEQVSQFEQEQMLRDQQNDQNSIPQKLNENESEANRAGKRSFSSQDLSEIEKRQRVYSSQPDGYPINDSVRDEPIQFENNDRNDFGKLKREYNFRKKAIEVIVIDSDSDTGQSSSGTAQDFAKNRGVVRDKEETMEKGKSANNSDQQLLAKIKEENVDEKAENKEKISKRFCDLISRMRDVLVEEQNVTREQFTEMKNQVYRDYRLNPHAYKQYWRYVKDWNDLSEIRKKAIKTVVSLQKNNVETGAGMSESYEKLVNLGDEQKPSNRAVDWLANNVFRAVVRALIGKESPQVISKKESLAPSVYRLVRYMSRAWGALAQVEMDKGSI